MNFVSIILLSHVKMCWNKTSTWAFGTTEYDMVVHRFVHVGRLCIDLEQHPRSIKDPIAEAEAELADWVAHCRFQSPNDGGLIAEKRKQIYAKHGITA